MKLLCLNTPGCKGFNTDGWLKNDTGGAIGNQPCDLYTKIAGPAPDGFHFFKITSYDANMEDLRQTGTQNVTTMAADCLADPQCAAFQTNGWLKNSVRTIQPSSVDLYVKLPGSKAYPLPPGPPPSPPPPPPPVRALYPRFVFLVPTRGNCWNPHAPFYADMCLFFPQNDAAHIGAHHSRTMGPKHLAAPSIVHQRHHPAACSTTDIPSSTPLLYVGWRCCPLQNPAGCV